MLLETNNTMANLNATDIERIFWRNAAEFFGFAKGAV